MKLDAAAVLRRAPSSTRVAVSPRVRCHPAWKRAIAESPTCVVDSAMGEQAFTPRAILVTGGCGFIGSNFVKFLTSRFESLSVINYDRMTYCSRAPVVSSPLYKLYKANLTDASTVMRVLNDHDIDTVVHFAAQTHVDRSFGNSMVFTDDNVKGTHTLLECMRAYGKVKRFVHISTDEVYGEVSDDHAGCKEQSLLNPTNPYAATKAAAEFMVRSYGHSFNLPFIITRGNNVYGEFQYPDKLIPKFINHLMKDEKLPIHGVGNSRRNFIHAEDVCAAVWTTVCSGAIGEIYNIGSSDEFSVREVASKLISAMKNTSDEEEFLEFVRDREFNDYRYCIDTTKLTDLGWSPRVGFAEGLERVIKWYHDNPSYWNRNKKWLVYGSRGWIGSKLSNYIADRGDECVCATSRADNASAVRAEILEHQPDRILCVLGRTHGPGYSTIDYLEQKGQTHTNIRDNLYAPFVLARLAEEYAVHFTYLGTGCIFSSSNNDVNFTEDSEPNFFGSEYSVVKGFTDKMSKLFPGMLNCRIRMPISTDTSPRNFISKICKYEKIHSVPNSMTVLEELLPIMLQMASERETGTVNLTNPGVISHNEVLELYKKYVDPTLEWKNFNGKELMEVIAAARSNNKLNTSRLEKFAPSVRNIHDAVTVTMQQIAQESVKQPAVENGE